MPATIPNSIHEGTLAAGSKKEATVTGIPGASEKAKTRNSWTKDGVRAEPIILVPTT
jgi:hypothetical protein